MHVADTLDHHTPYELHYYSIILDSFVFLILNIQSHTFQLVLTTDGALWFAVMNYAEIALEEDEFREWGEVGVYSRTFRRNHLHPNSTRPAIVHIADETGNTGQLGQWVFRTDDLNTTTTTTTTTTGTTTGV